ncbi:MAG: zinc ABC transporter substrate-binding protein [Bacteroidota bacterium]
MKVLNRYISLLFCLLLLASCANEEKQSDPNAKPMIVTTTGMIGDAVEAIVGDDFDVISLMGPGVDPHLYKAKRGDLISLRNASSIIYNGLHLEGKMGEILEKLGKEKHVVALGEGINEDKLIFHGESQDSKDPHIWFDVALWMQAVDYAGKALMKEYPDLKEKFAERMESYMQDLSVLDSFARSELATIPVEQRVLITAHDAFSYFGRAYQVEVRGLQGISTVAEFGLKDVKELVDFIVDRKIKAVFVESSIPAKSLEAVVDGCLQKGHEISIGGTLYSDAMGEKGTDAGSYPGMVRSNVNTIVGALR